MVHVWASAARVQVSIGELGSLLVDSAGKASRSFLSCSGNLEFFSQSCCSFAVNAMQGGNAGMTRSGDSSLEAKNCKNPDPSLEFTGWRALQPIPFHFMVVTVLRSGKMLIYVIHFTPFLPTCSYT